jgi:hypothetical protein
VCVCRIRGVVREVDFSEYLLYISTQLPQEKKMFIFTPVSFITSKNLKINKIRFMAVRF